VRLLDPRGQQAAASRATLSQCRESRRADDTPRHSRSGRNAIAAEFTGVRRPLRHETDSLADGSACNLTANDPVEATVLVDVDLAPGLDETQLRRSATPGARVCIGRRANGPPCARPGCRLVLRVDPRATKWPSAITPASAMSPPGSLEAGCCIGGWDGQSRSRDWRRRWPPAGGRRAAVGPFGYSLSPAVAEMVGCRRERTASMISLGSMPWR
jgi:hypothetical protein